VALVIVSIGVLVVLTVWMLGGVRIVRPFERGVVERLGRFRRTVEPGLRTMRPIVDTMHMVDMREQLLELTSTGVMTKDCVAVEVDTAVCFAPVQAETLLYGVADFRQALTTLAHTAVRTAVGELPVDEALTARGDIGMRLRTLLDDASRTWGVEVRRVELPRVEAPADLVAAMVEEARAERVRDALVAEAEGERQSTIARADGERKSAELKAQSERAVRRTAAEADADAIRILYRAIKDCDLRPDEIAARSVEVLRDLAAAGAALTVVLPTGVAPPPSAVSPGWPAPQPDAVPMTGPWAPPPPPIRL
jgi:regulator of protease activity HflC (stomatin/prohibitin superfamily)